MAASGTPSEVPYGSACLPWWPSAGRAVSLSVAARSAARGVAFARAGTPRRGPRGDPLRPFDTPRVTRPAELHLRCADRYIN